MEPLAHSARPSKGISAQPYAVHVENVLRQAQVNAAGAAKFLRYEADKLTAAVSLAAEFHDLGKLAGPNQDVLASVSSREALPINHADAGVAHLLSPQVRDLLAASMVYAHHAGLPDYQDQRNHKAGYVLRDVATKGVVDQELEAYLQLHRAYVRPSSGSLGSNPPGRLATLFYRFALSCLVDADHQDTARHYGQGNQFDAPPLRPADRLARLDKYVASLSGDRLDGRTLLRKAVYKSCRDAAPNAGMFACDSPVGTGKTTAIMAHMLHAAVQKNLRRIFVVLPFTNIIDQSVEVYRDALALPGERLQDVVSAHHHRAEFEDLDSRQFAFLWHAPIVVTTAVQFFETLASNHPSAIRKMHQLPGSAIFIDEAHAALPVHLWPQGWLWLLDLQSHWGCHLVLGSGSLNRFWELEEFSNPPSHLPDLVPQEIGAEAADHEQTRVSYKSNPDPIGLNDLLEWIPSLLGPRLLIVNTVQSAAVIAAKLLERTGHQSVEHLSTALCPRDRGATLERIKARLRNSADNDWTLVATSCVEAGVNISFRTGLRERCSLNSLVQIGGRVNREGVFVQADVWDFQLRHDGLLRPHPAFDTSANILGELFEESTVSAQFCTEAMRREIRQRGMKAINDEILKAERNLQFPLVADKFKVIDSDTVVTIVDPDLVSKIETRQKIEPSTLQVLSVQIWRYREIEYALKALPGYAGLYAWTLDYDDFLGYMAGVLQVAAFKQQGGSVI